MQCLPQRAYYRASNFFSARGYGRLTAPNLASYAKFSVGQGGEYTLYGLGRTSDDVALRCKSPFFGNLVNQAAAETRIKTCTRRYSEHTTNLISGWYPSIALQHLMATTGAGRYSPSRDSRIAIDQ